MDFIVIENCSVATTSGSCAIPLEIDDSPRVLETRYGSKKSFNGKHVKNLGKFKATTPSSVGKWESVMSDVPKPIATTPEKGVPPSQESSPPSKSSFNSSFKTGTEVGKTFFKDLLKVCTNEECCERIKIPGYSGSMPFLQAAESILSNFFGGTNHLELTGPVVFPPIIKKIGDQEQRGFAAEYEVYQELKNSKLPMYVFYSLKASHKNEELGDFILVTQSSVIILEVKAFSLAEPPSPKDLEILEKRLLNQYEDQRLRVVTILENYLLEHGWDKKSLPVKYFVLFANTKRPRQENMDFKNAIFKDNYMETITEISDSEKEVATKVLWNLC
ncbi:uncharacterized protein LOC136026264 [Artemia franciscana]|uniref:uncharacterized protein LOC136026264 n=1 Tax=Artemia franciscana TaxID=6661 RepID=UPI0032DA0654